jgi:hypothetical protein
MSSVPQSCFSVGTKSSAVMMSKSCAVFSAFRTFSTFSTRKVSRMLRKRGLQVCTESVQSSFWKGESVHVRCNTENSLWWVLVMRSRSLHEEKEKETQWEMSNHRQEGCRTSSSLHALSEHHTGFLGILLGLVLIILFVHMLRPSCGQQ